MGKHIIGFIVFALLSFACIKHSSGQYFSSYDPGKEYFQQQVKLIEEFIDRFNGEKTTLLNKLYARANKGAIMPRSMMVVSLFNLENKSFTDNDSKLKEFFSTVMDKAHPQLLNFNDGDWYAESKGLFMINDQVLEIPLVLHIMSHGDEWAKWMITGIGNTAASKEAKPSVSIKRNAAAIPQFIATSAYATNFSELHYIFAEQIQSDLYLEHQLLAASNGKQFIDKIKTGKLKFLAIKSTRFHFYQIPGWVFTVEQFSRKSFNSGWLISSVVKTTDAEKMALRKQLLNR